MDEIFAKIEGGQLLTPSEVSTFYREYNKTHNTRIKSDGSLAKVVVLYRQWKNENESVKESQVAESSEVVEQSAETTTTTSKKNK